MFRVSAQKLNSLGQLIKGLPLPSAVLQMRYSVKQAARTVHDTLVKGEQTLRCQGGQPNTANFIVGQAMVGKGKYIKRIDIKGRGRHGVIWSPHSFMRIQLLLPNVKADLKKLLHVKFYRHEHKPVYGKLDY